MFPFKGFLYLGLNHKSFSHPPFEDFCFSWEPGSEFTARAIPQESFWHLFPGTSVNLSEGQGVQAVLGWESTRLQIWLL